MADNFFEKPSTGYALAGVTHGVISHSPLAAALLTPDRKLRRGLIGLIISGLRSSRGYAPLAEAAFNVILDDWEPLLDEIPTEDLEKTRIEGLKRGLKEVHEFLHFYRVMWGEARAAREADERITLQAEIVDGDEGRYAPGVGSMGAEMQKDRWRKGFLAVSCLCLNDHGMAVTAVLDFGGQNFICPNSICSFSWPAQDYMNAPVRGMVIEKALPAPGVVRPGESDKAREARALVQGIGGRYSNTIQRAAESCQIDLATLHPRDMAHFRAWVAWYSNNYHADEISRPAMDATWHVWAAEYEERLRTDPLLGGEAKTEGGNDVTTQT